MKPLFGSTCGRDWRIRDSADERVSGVGGRAMISGLGFGLDGRCIVCCWRECQRRYARTSVVERETPIALSGDC